MSLFPHPFPKETIPLYQLAEHNSPPESPWIPKQKYQCVFVALQRSTQCHLQCISTFGNVAFNLFQPMKWIRWLTSLRGSWVRYKERLLLKPEKAFDVNVVDQHSALIILLPKFIFYCWYKLILTSLAIGPQHRSRWHFWVLSWVCTIQMLICGADQMIQTLKVLLSL